MYNLREHNIAPYKEIVEAYNNGAHFVIYTCGTGVGKSYVASAVIDTYDFQNVLYIVPSVSIIADLIHRAGYHKYLENNHIVFKTFNAFSTVEQAKEILSLYDFVIIDEVHHLGSEVYGCNIQEAMKEAPCQFLGLTATPIRESDNVDIRSLADVAVQGYTVADAITAGMMPKLEYVCCSPDLDDIEAAASCNAKLKTDYNASKSLMREIIETNKVSKWLVYFSRVQDIEDHYDLMQELFPDFVVIKVAVAYQNTDKVAALIQQFEKVVIMSCDSILEGIHTEGVQGIIIMRNVTVVSVFEQMIGRVCKIGNTENPIIIDCQNVWRLLKKKKYSSRLSENSVFEQSARDIFVTSLRNKRYIDIEQVLLEHQDSLSNAGSCEVDGVLWTWKSNQDLCRQLGKSVGYVSTLRVKGLSYPEIISRVTSTNSCEIDGVLWTWKSDTDLSRKLGKSSSYVFNFRKKGFSYPEIIRQGSINAAGSCEVDGVLWSWENEKDLSRKLGKNETYVSRLRRDGYSYTEIIRQGSATTAGSCIVDGVRWSWKNNQDLSRQLGKSANYVSARRRDGLSYPEIISPRSVNTAGSCMVDGVFWEWENDADLGRKLGRSSNYVSANRRKGLDYLEIIRQNTITFESCEVDGVSWKWKNDSDLSKQLGKSSSYVSTLRRAGLSYPEIISRVVSTNSCEVDGVLWTWKNDADLSKKLGKNAGFVSDNRQRGLSYPELIRRSASTTAGSCEVDGVLWSWKSDVDLCKQLGKSDTYVYKCRRKGLSYPKIIKQGLLTTAGSCVVDGVFWSWENEKDLSRKLGRNHGYVARLRQNGLSYPEIIRQGLSTTAGSCEVNGMLWSWKNNPDLSRQLGKNAAYVSTLRRAGLSYPEIIRKCTTDDGSGSGNSTKDMLLFKNDDEND